MSLYLVGVPVTYSYTVNSGVITHTIKVFSNDHSLFDMIDIPQKSSSCFYEVEILKGGGAIRADIVNCSIVAT